MGLVKLGRYGYALRDCPNVIIPSLANPPTLTSTYLTDSWGGWPANYREVIASTAAEYLLTHAFLSPGLGGITTVDGVTGVFFHMHLLIGKGAAGSEAVIAEAMASSGVAFSASGFLGGESCSCWETITRTVPLAPVIVPAASRLAVEGQVSGAPTQRRGAIYLTGYPTASFDFANVPAFDELFQRGCRPAYSDIQVITAPVTVTGHATVAWTLGAWVQVGGALDDDYLYDQITALNVAPYTGAHFQFEVGLGPDVDHVVIQARGGHVYALTSSTSDCQFPLPFIGYKGEGLWIRAACGATGSRQASVCLHAKRFS